MTMPGRRILRRSVPMVTAGLLVAAVLVGAGPFGPASAQTTPPHWGPYRWSGGAERADVRAFFLFDRTGDPRIGEAIRGVANGWNSAREVLPQLPYIAVYRDDANVGKCFVNQTPGYSVATACVIPRNIEGVRGLAARNPDAQGHLIGAAMAVSDGLSADETFTAVCHTMGHIMGLENSADLESCMSHEFGTQKKWYTSADAAAILSVYEHSDTGGPTTSSSSTTTSSSSTTS
jgi:hypothetical protein